MSAQYEVMVFKETVVFNYTLPGEDETRQITRELTLMWEDGIEKFFEQYTDAKPYEIHSFKNEKDMSAFIDKFETENDEIIDDVEEEISRKTKFSFDYTSPTYED